MKHIVTLTGLLNSDEKMDEDVASVLKKLDTIYREQNSIFLTGSRFFGTHTEKSDYDFFIEKCRYPHFDRKRMEFLGFSLVAKQKPSDEEKLAGIEECNAPDIFEVYRIKTKNTSIDVCFVYSRDQWVDASSFIKESLECGWVDDIGCCIKPQDVKSVFLYLRLFISSAELEKIAIRKRVQMNLEKEEREYREGKLNR